MNLVIVSGLSGSGKSIALNTLEDCGYYCIDNLPIALLKAFIEDVTGKNQSVYKKTAIGIDSRTHTDNLNQFTDTLKLVKKLNIDYQVLFLQAERETLLKRYSETRRKHPLTSTTLPLIEAIDVERDLLKPIAKDADLLIDTTQTNIHELRKTIRLRVGVKGHKVLSLYFQSFGFKNGIPLDSDFVFDARCLPNPHWNIDLRPLTGQDQKVLGFLNGLPEVCDYLTDITNFLQRWIHSFESKNRSYLNISIGCTGGRHRSVYLVEKLNLQFSKSRYNILIHHRELNSEANGITSDSC